MTTSSELTPLYNIKIWRCSSPPCPPGSCVDITGTIPEIIEDIISIKVAVNVEGRPGTATIVWENDPVKDIREGDAIEIWMGWEKADGSTDLEKVFDGEIQDVKMGSWEEEKTIIVNAKDWFFLFLVDKITKSYPTPINVQTILKEILNAGSTAYLQLGVPGRCQHRVRDTAKIEATLATRIMDFVGEPILDCVNKMSHVAQHDFFIDPLKEVNWFKRNSKSSGYSLGRDDLIEYVHDKPYDLICNKAKCYGRNNKPIPWNCDDWSEALSGLFGTWDELDDSWTSISLESYFVRWGSKAIKITADSDPSCVKEDKIEDWNYSIPNCGDYATALANSYPNIPNWGYCDSCCPPNNCDCGNGNIYPECCFVCETAPPPGSDWQLGFHAEIPASADPNEVIIIRKISFEYYAGCSGAGLNSGGRFELRKADGAGGKRTTPWRSTGGINTGYRTWTLQTLDDSDTGMPIIGQPGETLWIWIYFSNQVLQCLASFACVGIRDVKIWWNYSKSCSQRLGVKLDLNADYRVDLSTKQAPKKLKFALYPSFKLARIPGMAGYPSIIVKLYWEGLGDPKCAIHSSEYSYLQNNKWNVIEIPVGGTGEGWTKEETCGADPECLPPNKKVRKIEIEISSGIVSKSDFIVVDWLYFDGAKWFGEWHEASSETEWGYKFKEIFDDTCYSDEEAARLAKEFVLKYRQPLDVLKDVEIDFDNMHKLIPGYLITIKGGGADGIPELESNTPYRMAEITHVLNEDFEYTVQLVLSDPPEIVHKAKSLAERARRLEQKYEREPAAPAIETEDP